MYPGALPRGRLRLRTTSEVVALAMLAGAQVLVTYRAAHQAITYDEAVTYTSFLSGPFDHVFTRYNANNHVLFSLLARVSVALFGVSEFALRLPTITSCAVFCVSLFLVARRLLGSGVLFLLTVVVIAFNPLLLDLLVAARGYGLATALLMVALHQVVQGFDADQHRARHWRLASIALGLSVSANLTFLFPATALIASTVLADWVGPSSRPRAIADVLRRSRPLVLGGPLAALTLLIVPLTRAEREHFFLGADTLRRGVASLVEMSVHHDQPAWPPGPERPATSLSMWLVWSIVLPLFIWIATSTVLEISARLRLNRWPKDPLPAVIGSTILMTVGLVVAAHLVADVPYPFGRTGIYIVPLFALATAMLAARLNRPVHAVQRVIGAAVVILIAAAAIQSLRQLTTEYFFEWRFDAGSRDIMTTIAAWPRADRQQALSVAASPWLYAPALDFYRTHGFQSSVGLIEEFWHERPADFDFFVVAPGDDVDVAKQAGELVYVHRVSGALLLVNPARVGGRVR